MNAPAPAYVVHTIGDLGCACAAGLGDVQLDPRYDPRTDQWWLGRLLAKAREHAAEAAEDLREARDRIAKAVTPDPAPLTLDVLGPGGWGRYVLPGLALVVVGGVGIYVYAKRGSHVRR